MINVTATPAHAQRCSPAATQGNAPGGWESYCWLDFSFYDDATARTTTGQLFNHRLTNTRLATNANLSVVKTSMVLSDGVSGSNPKAIPGAVVRYTITVTNIGNAPVDASTLILADPLPANFTCDASTPVIFTNGATPSGLNAFNASTMVTFYSQSGGGAPYSYTPTGGYDANIRGIRIAPTGTMAASTSTAAQPSFSVSF